jgi:hypothetical protein
VLPWLITTTGWPALTAHVAGATERVVVDPAIVAGATAGALAFAVALLRRGRAREHPGRRST